MVGRDKDGELMWARELSWGDCCFAAASSADAAVRGSCFDFGEVEKKEVSRIALEVEGRRGISRFSESAGGVDGATGAEVTKGLNEALRDMVKRDPSVLIDLCDVQTLSQCWDDSASKCVGVCLFGLVELVGGRRRC